MTKLTLDDLKNNKKVRIYLEKADAHLAGIGYTEHGLRHANIVGKRAHDILLKLNYKDGDARLAAIAGFLHDIGNMVGRVNHGQAGALLVRAILEDIGMDIEDIALVMSAIANHEEETGDPTNIVSASLIIADKSDVHRSRVRNPNLISAALILDNKMDPMSAPGGTTMGFYDIHDRVNYAATESELKVDPLEKSIVLELTIDTKISDVMEYFEIFLSRMIICRKAAKFLGCDFHLVI
ncbi:MAG: HD domain-containing protein, partial [Nitrospirae bacterium]|nr:HD domain-containing protein [Nitrospirota bacterium]